MEEVSITGKHVEFHVGDEVLVLYQGQFDGMPGRFAGPAEDPDWVHIEEPDGSVRSHPVLWLRPPGDAGNRVISLAVDGLDSISG